MRFIVNVLSRGQTKCLVIAKIPDSSSYRRVDFLYTTPEEYPFSILYFTGSKIFNTVMRHQALEMGFSMNEHGLYLIEAGKKKGDKVKNNFYKEKDIFDFLNLEYKTPEERIDGRSVVIKRGVSEKPELIIEKLSNKEQDFFFKPTKISIKKNVTQKLQNLGTGLGLDLGSDIQNHIFENENEYEYKYNIDHFKKNGIRLLDKLDENQLSCILKEANNAYFNKQPLMTDNEYDIVKDYIKEKFPLNKTILDVGAPVEKNKVILPYYMASMDKIKPDTSALTSWMKKYKGPYLLSCKLDGVSGLYTTETNVPKLYTRGDGKIGQDISHLIPYLRLPKTSGLVIRGEFIIPKSIFVTKYKTKFANPRNMVAGIINNKTINESFKNTINDVHFVAYELIKPIKPPSDQLYFLSTMNIENVLYKKEFVLTNELLSSTLIEWRENYMYEMDGVIVTNDNVYERKDSNPSYAFAFKMVLSDQVAEAKVVDVLWTASKDGYLKPRVQIEPIQLGGFVLNMRLGLTVPLSMIIK